MIKPFALYDSLFIGNQLQNKLDDFSQYEIQLFCYLSCLLSLYDGNPISFWGYTFIKNDLGSPFSKEINDVIDNLVGRESMEKRKDAFLSISEAGLTDLDKLSKFPSNSKRIKYLLAACQSIKLLPYGIVKDSIIREPILLFANQHDQKRLLIDDKSPAYTVLYEQFQMLKIALNEKYDNLIIPAVVWLEYLAENKNDIYDNK